MKKGYWVIRTYVSGSVGEKIKYWIHGERPRKNKKNFKSDIKKQQQNESSAEKQMARLINANFSKGDILLGLDYSAEGLNRLAEKIGIEYDCTNVESMELFRLAAEKELRLCLRRVKRELNKTDVNLKYIAITSDMDGDTGELVRVHHHIVINAEALEVFCDKWNMGGVNYERLRSQDDYTPIAHYFIKQVRKIPDSKKYIPSRNLERPQPKDRIALNNSELRTPRGCKLLHRSEYRPNAVQYMRYQILQQRKEVMLA